MQVRLKNIVRIIAGHPFRQKIEHRKDGDYTIIQIKDINSQGKLSKENFIKTNIEDIKKGFLAKKDDVLITTRGLNRRAYYIASEIKNTVFVAQIFALRDLREDVKPAYLAWYINQKPSQNYLEVSASGSYIKNIRKDVLANMPIEIPPLETQRQIVEIHNLHFREIDLVAQIKEKREMLIKRLLLNAIKNGESRV